MSWFITALIAIGIFLVYNIIMICLFGVPYSLSGTFYLLEEKWKNSGILFSIVLSLTFIILSGPWAYISCSIGKLGIYLCMLPFLSSSFVIISAYFPNIRDSKEIEQVHTLCALIGAIFALLWVCIVCWKIMWIISIWILVIGGIAHLTKTAKSSRDFWLEWCIFGSTFTCILVEFWCKLLV